MRTDKLTLGFAYLRLSNEEAQGGESSSITNQRMIVQNYCKQNGITLVREFVDDGYSGGNFDRPAFQEMMRQLSQGKANTVITKDLSRLGRDMRESSYYAEQFFPEHDIHYIAIGDNFDTERENIMAPFLFAMNEVYLRDGSRKVKDVLRSKRQNGQYCACPPYGYRKDREDKHRLAPDEQTAPVVQRIFERAAKGDSSEDRPGSERRRGYPTAEVPGAVPGRLQPGGRRPGQRCVELHYGEADSEKPGLSGPHPAGQKQKGQREVQEKSPGPPGRLGGDGEHPPAPGHEAAL